MKRTYMLSQQYTSYILLVSFFLQSCGVNLPNPNIQPLIGQELIAQGGHSITCYQEAGILKANVKMNVSQGFSKTYQGAEVLLEQGVELVSLPSLDKKVQERRIQFQLARGGQSAKVIIYKGAGLVGGMNEGGNGRAKEEGEKQKGYSVTPIQAQGNVNRTRKGLNLEASFQETLLSQLPEGYTLGATYNDGDCFFDALAQWVNIINHTDINNVKYLRMLCHNFYERNKDLVDKWAQADYGGLDKGKDEYYKVQYDAEEMDRLFNHGTPIWGRPWLEGEILCKELNLRGILSIEVYPNPENPSIPVISCHLVNQEEYKSITEEEVQALIQAGDIPVLVNEQKNIHFVPLLKKQQSYFELPQGKNPARVIIYKGSGLMEGGEGEDEEEDKGSYKSNPNHEKKQQSSEGADINEKGADINEKGADGKFSLHHAALNGHLNTVQWLLENGTILEEKNNDGNTALLLAAYNGHLEAVKWLRGKGARLNEKNNDGNTALHYAAYNGHLDTVKWLLGNGAILIEEDNDGNTALMLAAANGHLDTVKWLWEKGARLEEKNNDYNTALMLAAANGHLDTVKWLREKGARLNEKDSYRNTALMLAAANGHLDTVKWLREKGARLNEKDSYRNTALMWAATNGHLETVKWLLENGAILIEEDNDGNTALMLAAANGHLETVKWLREKGARLNEKDRYGNTALLLAAINGHLKTVEWLLGNGAGLIEKDKYGNTALLLAATNGHLDTVQWLREKGARLNEKDRYGNTALMWAAANGHLNTVQWLLEKGAGLIEKNDDGNTALHYAAANGHLNTVQWLLEKGAGLEEKNNDGITALMWAEANDHLDTVKCLRANRASLIEKDNYGNTSHGTREKGEEEQRNIFDILPDELILGILMHLHPKDLGRLTQTSRVMKRFSEDDIIWKHIALKEGLGLLDSSAFIPGLLPPIKEYVKEYYTNYTNAVQIECNDKRGIYEEYDEDRDENPSYYNRYINVCFLERKGTLSKKVQNDAADYIKKLLDFVQFTYINLYFDKAKTKDHLEIIKKTMERYWFKSMDVAVNFHESASENLKYDWETFKKDIEQSQYERERRYEDRYRSRNYYGESSDSD
ncbi:MAG: ankyrin repeat domain-containing protein [Candidatus Amoebophilus sp.]